MIQCEQYFCRNGFVIILFNYSLTIKKKHVFVTIQTERGKYLLSSKIYRDVRYPLFQILT